MRTALAALLIAAAGAAFAQSGDAACKRDLLVADSSLRASRARMEDAATGSDADKCTAWRRHVETLKKAGAVFVRCGGRERVPEMESSAADFTRIIRERCGK